jgi:hypothetical protein
VCNDVAWHDDSLPQQGKAGQKKQNGMHSPAFPQAGQLTENPTFQENV